MWKNFSGNSFLFILRKISSLLLTPQKQHKNKQLRVRVSPCMTWAPNSVLAQIIRNLFIEISLFLIKRSATTFFMELTTSDYDRQQWIFIQPPNISFVTANFRCNNSAQLSEFSKHFKSLMRPKVESRKRICGSSTWIASNLQSRRKVSKLISTRIFRLILDFVFLSALHLSAFSPHLKSRDIKAITLSVALALNLSATGWRMDVMANDNRWESVKDKKIEQNLLISLRKVSETN